MDDCIESDIVFKWTYCCRLCLSTSARIDIFENEKPRVEIINKITAYLNVLIYAGDPMPRKLCDSCLVQIDTWHQFQLKCAETEANLKKRMQPFRALEFVQLYLDRASKSPADLLQHVPPVSGFVPMEVKTEPIEANPSNDCSEPPQSSGQTVDDNCIRDKDWAEQDNSGDTVYDDAGDSGLDILRQMAGEVVTGTEPEPMEEIPSRTEAVGTEESIVEGPTPMNTIVNEPLDVVQDRSLNVQVAAISGLDKSAEPATSILRPNQGENAGDSDSVSKPTHGSLSVKSNLTVATPSSIVPLLESIPVTTVDVDIPSVTSTEVMNVNDDSENVIVDVVGVKEEPGVSKEFKYNLRKRQEAVANYGEVDWPEDTRTPPPPKPSRQKVTPWKCEACLLYFSKLSNLKTHQSRIDCLGSQMDSYPCVICGKRFFSKSSVAEHNLCHMKIAFNLSADDLRNCRKCDSAFADPWRLKQHNSCHVQKGLPSQATQYPCKECGLVFIKKDLFEEHSKSHELGQQDFLSEDLPAMLPEPNVEVKEVREYACSLCIARFKGEDLLYDHRFAIHGIHDERVACSICSLKFRETSLLIQHMTSHQKQAVARKRSVARKQTTPISIKISNLRTLGKEPALLAAGSVRCRRCGVVFRSREELTRHENEKHKNLTPYLCRKCNRRFATRSTYLLHQREHSGLTITALNVVPETPSSDESTGESQKATSQTSTSSKLDFIKGMSCYNCKLQFKSEIDLQEHVNAHLKYGNHQVGFKHAIGVLFRFQCSGCPQLFSKAASLDKHKITRHDGSKVEIIPLEVPFARTLISLPLFKCKICKIKLYSQASFNFHNKIKHSQPVRPSLAFDKAQIEAPQFAGQIKVNAKQECPYCLKLYATNQIEGHILENHSSSQLNRNQCRYCGKVCNTSFNLMRHEMAHKKGKSHQCHYCNKIFAPPRTTAYRRHVARCAKLTSTTAEMTPPTPPQSAPPEDHVSHFGAKKKCTLCGNTYDTQSLLELHIMTAHGLTSMKNASVPERELWQEETNKIMREIGGVARCTLCQMQFDSPDAAAWHRSQHPRGNLYVLQIDDSMFQCTICDQLFSDKKIGLRHAEEHGEADIKPQIHPPAPLFSCPFCISKFATEDSIRSHIFYVHPGGSANSV